MNERFFDLKKDRQDRIINGAMRIFAENGYRHASTDEMVAAAGISKGLLFHYFKSKKGTWIFLYEYATRYMLLELREADRRRGCDFFEMYRLLVQADAAVLKKYPWALHFLKRADSEFDLVKVSSDEFPEDIPHAVEQHRQALLSDTEHPPFLSVDDAKMITEMLGYTRFGLIQELLENEDISGIKKRKKTAEKEEGTFSEGKSAPLYKQYAERLSDHLRVLRKMNI